MSFRIVLVLMFFYQPLISQQVIDKHYIKKHNIFFIDIAIPVDTKWLKLNKAFDSSINAQYFTFKYNNQGQCIEMNWQFCKFTDNTIDTTILSLIHTYSFEYSNDKLTKIKVNSISPFYEASYTYSNKYIIRNISHINNYNTITTKTDTVLNIIQCYEEINPYYFYPYPEQKCLQLNTNFLKFINFNKINILEIFDNESVVLQLSPLLSIKLE